VMPSNKPRNISAARKAAVGVLTESESHHNFFDHLVESSPLVGRLHEKDRSLFKIISYGVLQNRSRLDAILTHYIGPRYTGTQLHLKNILRTSIYQLKFLDRVPDYAVISDAVELAKMHGTASQGKFVNGVLRNYQRKPFDLTLPESAHHGALSNYFSMPKWLIRMFASQYGEQNVIAWLQKCNQTPRIFLRDLEPGKAVPAELQQVIMPLEECAPYYTLQAGISPENMVEWNKGRFIVQDPGAGLAVALANVTAGQHIIELCAAPGGKAIALAKETGPSGKLTAIEKAEKRLPHLQENIERTSADNIEVVNADARTIELPEADVVLLDAPCGGSGVLARRVDLRWQRTPEDIQTLARLQMDLIKNAARMVKKNGLLIYATCSIDKIENEAIISAFLKQSHEFKLESAEGAVESKFVTPEGFAKALPHIHHIDGAFAARIRRRA